MTNAKGEVLRAPSAYSPRTVRIHVFLFLRFDCSTRNGVDITSANTTRLDFDINIVVFKRLQLVLFRTNACVSEFTFFPVLRTTNMALLELSPSLRTINLESLGFLWERHFDSDLDFGS